MAYRGYAGDGFVGNFLSTALLEAKFPAVQNAGRTATVETAGLVALYFSTGAAWVVLAQ